MPPNLRESLEVGILTEIFIYLPLGVVVGVLADLFGIGGGIIFVPVLLLGFDFA